MQSCVSASRDSLGDSWLQGVSCGTDLALLAWGGHLRSNGRWGIHVFARRRGSLLPVDGVCLCKSRTTPLRRPTSMLTMNGLPLLKISCSQRSTITLPSKRLRMPSISSRHRPHQPTGSPAAGVSMLSNGVIASPLGNRSFSDLFALLRTANHSSIYAAASFWWTAGGGDFKPFGFCCRHMPDPILFTSMLTGSIDSAVR